MNLVEVNVIQPQAFKAVVDLGHDVLAGRAAAVRPACAHLEVHFCCYYYFVAVEAELADKFAGDFLAAAELVDVGCVEKVYAQFYGLPEEGFCVLELHCPRENAVLAARLAEAHHSQTDARNINAGIAQFYVLHE